MSALPSRTPLRFRVASDRPWIAVLPRAVIVIQSPCRQTPGYTSKYVARYRLPSGSFHSFTGIVGIGLVTTSSPTSPRTGRPSAPNASAATPSARQEISPGQTGTVGAPITSADTTSVPPDIDISGIRGPNWSRTQKFECAGSGDPVAPISRSAGSCGGVTPL